MNKYKSLVVEHSLECGRLVFWSSQVKSKDWKIISVTSLVKVHHWRARAGLVSTVSV